MSEESQRIFRIEIMDKTEKAINELTTNIASLRRLIMTVIETLPQDSTKKLTEVSQQYIDKGGFDKSYIDYISEVLVDAGIDLRLED